MFLAANISGQNVLLLEKMTVPGKKILLSGGGMCNLTNCDSTDDFLSSFGHKSQANFLKPALLNLTTAATRQWFGNHGLTLVIREDGKVFPASLKAQSVVDCLRRGALENKVIIKTSAEVTALVKEEGSFSIITTTNAYKSNKVVIATGGKSFESTGSDGFGYILAKSFGHRIIEPTQALTAVTLEDYALADLAGNSLRQSSVDFFRNGDMKKYKSDRGDLLFTHKGISGPVILNNSRYIQKHDLLKASLISTGNKENARIELHQAFLSDPKKKVNSIVKALGVFSGLAGLLLNSLNLSQDEKCGNLNKKKRNQLISLLLDYPFKVSRKGYFSSAMVTAGGVDLGEVDRKTMESKLSKGLYFAGEVLDIDGNTGGYNIQAAFSTAYLIASTLKKSDK
ncbi:MAG: aminoacetone oxidase family FAD-binding enzyme [Spirochaetaceae bacterium]|nr:aminoacetone oxidase family FAD-binding enzyme [Spirochaetaceae bacterium]